MKRPRFIVGGLALLLIFLLVLAFLARFVPTTPIQTAQILQEFNGASALRDVEYQVNLGPRTPGSEAHRLAADWIADELKRAGWQVSFQESQSMGHPIRNIVARWGEGDPWVILGAHYDSRLVADQDPDLARRKQPVPGANDSASGVAVLLELARILPARSDRLHAPQLWLVFFDAEDQGRLPGWDWILGSRAFVSSLHVDPSAATPMPEAAVILDMIGDVDLNLYWERNSDAALSAQIWEQAAGLGYGQQFVAQPRHTILDDHIPFKDAGIPAVDLIDFDYVHWHTTADTADKVSAHSLEIVGKVLLAWLTRP